MLEGKIALITGGSAGIGLAVAEQLTQAGCKVALVARKQGPLDEAVQRLGADKAAAFALDVADLNAVAALPQRVRDRFGALDILVNNAGLHHRGRFLAVDAAQLGDMVTVNLTSPVVLSRAAAPLLRRGGAIVNVASLAGMVPMRNQVTYGATKAGLRAFSRALRDELCDQRITVSVVSPGPVDTGFFDGQVDEVADIVFSQPMSTAAEVAKAVLKCIEQGDAELAVPWLSGKLCTLGYVAPAFSRAVRPLMEKRGKKAKAAFKARKQG